MAESLRVYFVGNATRCAACHHELLVDWKEDRGLLVAGCANKDCADYGKHGDWPGTAFRLLSQEEIPCPIQTKETTTC